MDSKITLLKFLNRSIFIYGYKFSLALEGKKTMNKLQTPLSKSVYIWIREGSMNKKNVKMIIFQSVLSNCLVIVHITLSDTD